jgi:PPOX class probable F420-dependent enzyme
MQPTVPEWFRGFLIEAESERCRICFLIDLPAPVVEFLKRPNPAVIAFIRPDGFPMSVATWYDWEDGLILVNMHESRSRLRWLRANPKASLTALGKQDWYRHVSLYGSVVKFAEDADLADIDRLCLRYTGKAFSNRRAKRVSAWIEPQGWHGWDDEGEVASTDVRT